VDSLGEINCRIRGGDGQPPAKWSGSVFASVVPVSWSPTTGPDSFNSGLDETYNVDIVLSMRTGKIPDDKLMGEAFLKAVTGLEPIIRTIMVVMRKNRYTDSGDATGGILTRANALITGTNHIIEPLRWSGNSPQPIPVGPDWFHGTGEDARAYGWRYEMHYIDARRPQTESNLE